MKKIKKKKKIMTTKRNSWKYCLCPQDNLIIKSDLIFFFVQNFTYNMFYTPIKIKQLKFDDSRIILAECKAKIFKFKEKSLGFKGKYIENMCLICFF